MSVPQNGSSKSTEVISRRRFMEASAVAVASLSLPIRTLGAQPEAAAAATPTARTWPLVPHAEGQPVYISDFKSSNPASAFADGWDSDRWRLLPFEADSGSGVMVVAGQNANCADLTVQLPVKGWHAIYIGLTSHEAHSRVEAKLESDTAFALFTDHYLERRLVYERGYSRYSTDWVQEYFWKYADLTDEKIMLRQVKVILDLQNPDSPANLRLASWVAYIKAVPLTPVDVSRLEQDRQRTDTRRLIGTHDVTTPAAWLSWYSEEAIRRELEPYRNTDFFRIDWEGGKGDLTHYPSKIGRMVTFEWQKAQFHSQERLIAQSFSTLQQKGIDPFRVAVDHAHDAGIEFHASYRVSGFLYPPPRDERNTGGYYWQHQQWRGVGRDGRPSPRISYAFPEVRRWVVSLLEEMAGYPIDGVTILYNRRPPVVEYEPPIVDSFQRQYRLDPRQLDEHDPRWLAHRSTFVTAFMREVRQAMDRISEQRRGKRIQVSAIVMGTEPRNMYYGLDLATWVREKLVDWIIPYQSGDDLLSTRDSFDNARDFDYFARLVQGSECRAAPNLMPRELPPETYMRRAAALYRAGANGLYFWDSYQRTDYSDSWSALRRLGHREELEAWELAGSPRCRTNRNPLRRLGNWDLSYDSAS
jgi:hypothetical protein